MSGRSCSAACAVFFTRDPVTLEEATDRAVAKGQPLVDEFAAQFIQGGVWFLIENRQDGRGVGFDPSRPAISSKRLRNHSSLFAGSSAPAAEAGGAYAEPLAGLAMGQAGLNGGNRANAKIDG